ncbi:hypothetical protein MPRG_24180 [Mycobacterium paragordonae]|uniref:Uncharacterized protein n=1 Tax=Mycobacterium paragordonae TaxID=1389713 RepID=A0ABQ1C4E1_9MYCO|nr:hypothetical protein MPRG_24180 [Mycobacterium paragordonae]
MRSVTVSWARQTSPIPPRPNNEISAYRPNGDPATFPPDDLGQKYQDVNNSRNPATVIVAQRRQDLQSGQIPVGNYTTETDRRPAPSLRDWFPRQTHWLTD